MLVDCQTCPVRNVHCADCMVTALTAIPVGPTRTHTDGFTTPSTDFSLDPIADLTTGLTAQHQLDLPLDRAERRAVSVLVAAGLVSHHAANAARAVPDSDLGQLPRHVTMAG